MEGLILTGIIAYSHPHLQGIQVILLFIYIGCTMIKFITLFFKSDISGLHILHSRADLPPARRLPSCLCVSCSQRQTRIWFPSSSPHELELWRECQDSQKEITTGKSNLMQNLQKYLHLHNAQTPPFNHRSCSCQEQTVFLNLLDLIRSMATVAKAPPSWSSTASSQGSDSLPPHLRQTRLR